MCIFIFIAEAEVDQPLVPVRNRVPNHVQSHVQSPDQFPVQGAEANHKEVIIVIKVIVRVLAPPKADHHRVVDLHQNLTKTSTPIRYTDKFKTKLYFLCV